MALLVGWTPTKGWLDSFSGSNAAWDLTSKLKGYSGRENMAVPQTLTKSLVMEACNLLLNGEVRLTDISEVRR